MRTAERIALYVLLGFGIYGIVSGSKFTDAMGWLLLMLSVGTRMRSDDIEIESLNLAKKIRYLDEDLEKVNSQLIYSGPTSVVK